MLSMLGSSMTSNPSLTLMTLVPGMQGLPIL